MKIELSDIDEQSRSFSTVCELPPDRLDNEMVQDTVSVRLDGTISKTPLGFLCVGESLIEGPLTCSRCLNGVDWTHKEAFSFLIQDQNDAPEEEELGLEQDELDIVFVEDSEFDLADLAAEQVQLGLPMRIICSDDCKGLCPSCGANRNLEGQCACDPEIDPRWEALRDITER